MCTTSASVVVKTQQKTVLLFCQVFLGWSRGSFWRTTGTSNDSNESLTAGDMVMHGGEGIYRVELATEVSREELQPEIKLKTTVQVSEADVQLVQLVAD